MVPYEVFKSKDSFLVVGAVNSRRFKTLRGYPGKKELATGPDELRIGKN